jgi:broad specificity phosphatase PhoE
MLFLVRHGLTVNNQLKKVSGTSNTELSKTGIKQAQKIANWASKKNINLIVCSDSLRAVQTAEIISRSIEVSYRSYSSLRERDYGKYDDLGINELITIRKKRRHKFTDPTQDWNNVDSVEKDQSVFNRTFNLLRTLCPNQSQFNLMCISHAGVIKSFLYCCFDINPLRNNCIKIPNGSVTILDYDFDGNFRLIALYPEL